MSSKRNFLAETETQDKDRIYLHETAQSDDGVIQTCVLNKPLCTILDLHQGDLRMLVAVVNGVEDILLNPHGLSTLD